MNTCPILSRRPGRAQPIRRSSQITAALAALACVAGALPALAGGPPELPSVMVPYHDLDPSTKAGAKALHHRIAAAARAVCGDVEGSLIDLAVQQEVGRCTHDAIAAALTEVNRRIVTAVSQNRRRYVVVSRRRPLTARASRSGAPM